MPRPAPQPAPEPVTLFYQQPCESLQPQGSLAWLTLLVPFLLGLALIAPAIVLLIPVSWLACKINNVPFTFNLPILFDRIDKLYEDSIN